MGNVIGGMTISLDGYINDRSGSVGHLYTDLAALQETPFLKGSIANTGAVIMGRRTYEMARGDFTGYEFQVPIFVLTHHPPKKVAKGQNKKLRFTFVSDGIDRAVTQAKTAAGDQDVMVVGGASTIRQLLSAGLLDELELGLMPVLLHEGQRLFDGLELLPELERVRVIESPAGRTELIYRIVK